MVAPWRCAPRRSSLSGADANATRRSRVADCSSAVAPVGELSAASAASACGAPLAPRARPRTSAGGLVPETAAPALIAPPARAPTVAASAAAAAGALCGDHDGAAAALGPGLGAAQQQRRDLDGGHPVDERVVRLADQRESVGKPRDQLQVPERAPRVEWPGEEDPGKLAQLGAPAGAASRSPWTWRATSKPASSVQCASPSPSAGRTTRRRKRGTWARRASTWRRSAATDGALPAKRRSIRRAAVRALSRCRGTRRRAR